MSASAVHQLTLNNGLVLLAETMPGVQSAAFSFLLPAGAIYEPDGRGGLASMLGEWIVRGAGDRDSHELLAALDQLGINHSEGAQTVHSSAAAATLGRHIVPALEIYADILRRPAFDEEEVEPIRALALQSLQALEDDPASTAVLELRRRYYPAPWGRGAVGTRAGLEAVTSDDLRAFHAAHYRPNGSILAVAGSIDWPLLSREVERLFGDWEPGPSSEVTAGPSGPKRDHVTKDTQQIQIAMAYAALPFGHPDYYVARAAAAILGGYSSARLFTEVREKRGLCYSVYSNYESFKERAAVVCHAGTSADRAQETLDVTLAEIDRLSREGIEAEELETMRAGLKSALIMQQESTMSRSASLASDWYYLGRIRTLDEISAQLDAIEVDAVNAYLKSQSREDMTILTLGPTPLNVPN